MLLLPIALTLTYYAYLYAVSPVNFTPLEQLVPLFLGYTSNDTTIESGDLTAIESRARLSGYNISQWKSGAVPDEYIEGA